MESNEWNGIESNGMIECIELNRIIEWNGME